MTESATTETSSVTDDYQTPPTSASRRRWRVGRHLEANGLLIFTVAIIIFFSVYPETSATFPTVANIQVLLAGQSVLAIIAIAALIPLVANEWDLSVGAIAGMSAVFAASFLSSGSGIATAIAIAVGAAVLIGVANALIVTRFGVNAVITTLGMSTIIAGIVNQKTGGIAVVSNIPESLTQFGSSNWASVPRIAFVALAVALIAYYGLDHTPAGRYLYAFGANPDAARLVGIRVTLLLGSTFVVAGLLCGVAGVLQVANAGGAAPSVGPSFTLPALASAFLSAAAVKPGRYNVWGTIVALLFLAVLNSGLNLAGAPPYIGDYVNGTALIVGVAFAAYLGRLRARSRVG